METVAHVLAVVGPTASGKSALALDLAERLDAEILSADSRQVYRYLDIGTAKPTREERSRIVHHGIDICDPTDEYNAGMFGQDGRAVLERIRVSGRRAIVVGGSGLYLRSLIDGLFDGPSKDSRVRAELVAIAEREGPEALRERLRRVDPQTAERSGALPLRRVIRALEVFELTGRPISDHHRRQSPSQGIRFVQIGLRWPREQLYARINARAESMIKAGLVEEVVELKKRGYGVHLNALNTVGYKEVFSYLNGLSTETAMLTQIQQNTRRFAKRQMTWFRADSRIFWIDVHEEMNLEQLSSKALSFLSSLESKIR